ncbi:DUF3795 domain-containing protein [Candidatus Bathyarchaeota archaeon]|nr:DUF3795 domain-containing protein [Candidatus Bathyarchaeota archaeon]
MQKRQGLKRRISKYCKIFKCAAHKKLEMCLNCKTFP